jgi:hypothetical protein
MAQQSQFATVVLVAFVVLGKRKLKISINF